MVYSMKKIYTTVEGNLMLEQMLTKKKDEIIDKRCSMIKVRRPSKISKDVSDNIVRGLRHNKTQWMIKNHYKSGNILVVSNSNIKWNKRKWSLFWIDCIHQEYAKNMLNRLSKSWKYLISIVFYKHFQFVQLV